MIVAGCAAANNAANQSEQPYSAGYGLSSSGTTTDLYTELFGSRKQPAAPEAMTAATPPVQPATVSAPPQPVQPATAPTALQPRHPATASAASRQVQPAPAPTQIVQQPPAPPAPPPEPDVPAAYGITANGPTTDLFTELFGPRRRDSQ